MVSGAVIVTYHPLINELHDLISSVHSSLKSIVIVDNNSNNIDEIERTASAFDTVKVLKLSSNAGIGRAQNEGIQFLLNDSDIEAVILFDHDSHPEPDMINNLVQQYKRLTSQGCKVGAVGPAFIDPRTRNRYPIPFFSGLRLLKIYPPQGSTEPVLCSFLIASGCLMPRKVLEEVGLMNAGLFIDYIDIDWSFRAIAAGYSLFTCPDALMMHQVGDSRLKVFGREISIHSPLRRYYLARNSVLMMRMKHIGWQYKLRESFYTVSRVFVFLLFVEKRATYLKYICKGWYDGLLGRTGMYHSK